MVTDKKHKIKKLIKQDLCKYCGFQLCNCVCENEDDEDDTFCDCDFGCEICDPDDKDDKDLDGVDEEEWGNENPAKNRKKRYSYARHRYLTGEDIYPVFDWEELEFRTAKFLKDLIRNAEKHLVPDNGLRFSYDNVHLIHMSKMSANKLMELNKEARNSMAESKNHKLYHQYIASITEWELNNRK